VPFTKLASSDAGKIMPVTAKRGDGFRLVAAELARFTGFD
jgi:hypothetical protein